MNEGLARSLDQLRSSDVANFLEIGIRTACAAIPYADGSILELFGGLAQRRSQERLFSILQKMADILAETEGRLVDRSYFPSEEFQTIFLLVTERLATTHMQEKLNAFACALAHSGYVEHKNEDKEGSIRVLRDLEVRDLNLLRQALKRKADKQSVRMISQPNGRESLSRLLSLGLVSETTSMQEFRVDLPSLSASRSAEQYANDTVRALRKYMEEAPIVYWDINDYGVKFLNFLEAHNPDFSQSA